MFQGATVFNRDITIWNVGSDTFLTNMFFDATAMNNEYDSTFGFNPITSAFSINRENETHSWEERWSENHIIKMSYSSLNGT